MPRMGRVVLAQNPHHIVQRGHNRQVTFAEATDYERYLATLREFKEAYGVKVYAYCLMTNHVHLLLAPNDPGGIGKLMKRLAGRQTRHHNRLEGRSRVIGSVLPFASQPGPRESNVTRWVWPFLDQRGKPHS